MSNEKPPLLFSDVAYAIEEAALPDAIRHWLKAGLVETDAKYGRSWARFTFKDVVRLAVIARLVLSGTGVRRANDFTDWINQHWSCELEQAPNEIKTAMAPYAIVIACKSGVSSEAGEHWIATTIKDLWDDPKTRIKNLVPDPDFTIVIELEHFVSRTIDRAVESIQRRRKERERRGREQRKLFQAVARLRDELASREPTRKGQQPKKRPR